jgi:polyphenol oxidase
LFSSLLAQIPWLRHGFGTKTQPLSQDGMVSLQQIHSSDVLVADGQPGCVGEGDALITREPGVTISVRTADCYPILLVDPEVRAVAVVHAGWRGTAGRIVAKTLERMGSEFGADASKIIAAIGPGIGACCYEVGAEVAAQFGKSGSGKLNLAEENRKQLVAEGVAGSCIDVLGDCTRCDATRFHSYRRDKDAAGRMISFIGIDDR